MVAAGLRYGVDLEYDQLVVNRSPHHLDPGGRGKSSGGTLLVTFPHLLGDHPAKGNQCLAEILETL